VSRRQRAAKRLLQDVDTSASIVYMSALALFGSPLQEYEYETLELECNHMQLDVPSQNWEELYAALALRGDGRFMYEAMTFENTIVAFNGKEAESGSLQPVAPAEIAWAVREADTIVADLVNESIVDWLDYEPVGYTAVMCQAHGMVCVPPSLSFCEDRLDELTPECSKLRAEVKKAWGEQKGLDPREIEFGEDAIGIQLALMHAVETYVEKREQMHERQLQRLL